MRWNVSVNIIDNYLSLGVMLIHFENMYVHGFGNVIIMGKPCLYLFALSKAAIKCNHSRDPPTILIPDWQALRSM